MTPRRSAAVSIVCWVILSGCTVESLERPNVSPSSSPATSLVTGSAAKEMQRLCKTPSVPQESHPVEKTTPPSVLQVEREVEDVRGLQYRQPVAVDAVTHAELVRRISQLAKRTSPHGLLARRTRVWQLIGVLPPGVTIEEALNNYVGSQVIGVYDYIGKDLAFIGTEHPTPLEHLTLAHELTHAIDDQYFDLTRLDVIEHRCDDEALLAATGVVEGSAQFFSGQVALKFFTAQQFSDLKQAQAEFAQPTGVPPFILNLEVWPYLAGQNFINALFTEQGVDAVNRALQEFPVSTEQIIHPERYATDVPTPLDIPELAGRLGPRWHDLDVQTVGEEWLSAMLRLRLDPSVADQAAAGWDGGLYRAWTDGDRLAVVLRTAWDSHQEAVQFAAEMRDWLRPSQAASVGTVAGSRVDVFFATDTGTLARLRSSIGST